MKSRRVGPTTGRSGRAGLAAQAVAGVLPNTVSRRYPLAEAPRAYADLVHEHVRGKFVVTPPNPA